MHTLNVPSLNAINKNKNIASIQEVRKRITDLRKAGGIVNKVTLKNNLD